MKKKLPIGIQNFRKIREDGYYYVDKTPFIEKLIENGSYYFLSRPRRFGKSLFVDTMQELFEGNEKLFNGLYIHDIWDWTKQYPVIKISFGGGVLKSREELDFRIRNILEENAVKFGLKIDYDNDISGLFRSLIQAAESKFEQRVVILIDEYDKPILDNIENQEIAFEMREGLKNFYSPIKEADAHLKFAFLTGVSKFSKVSLFSGLNNLTDITLDERYSSICGYTEQDMDDVFSVELKHFKHNQVRDWYNGYNWLGDSVYNPFDILKLFDTKEFKPYWFETGTPTFLIKLLLQRGVYLPELTRKLTDELLLSTFDVDNIPTESLMFQSGYLTIKEKNRIFDEIQYTLGYPNKEVYQSLHNVLLGELLAKRSGATLEKNQLWQSITSGNIERIESILKALYAAIPYQWYVKNNIADYEGYYASVFYAFFASLGLDIICEESSNAGRLDMAVRLEDKVYLFEFKISENNPAGSALQQIKDNGYADKYKDSGKEIYIIGIEFSKEKRQIENFEWEPVK